jgi:hypothetical protein
MIGDVLRHFQFAAVLQVGGDAGGAESMIADLRLDAGRLRPKEAATSTAPSWRPIWLMR